MPIEAVRTVEQSWRDHTSRSSIAGACLVLLAGCGGHSGSTTTPPPPPPTTYTVGGTVQGLTGTGLVLQLSGSESLAISAIGSFQFKTALPGGGVYTVTVLSAPYAPSQGCSLQNSSGNIAAANVTNIVVDCTTPALNLLAGIPGGPGNIDGTGTAARFYAPEAVALDTAGNVYVADSNNNSIRKIMAGGIVTTFAGLSGPPGYVDGSLTDARFSRPRGIVIDAAGNVYVADYGNAVIRKISTAGVVATLAGTAGQIGAVDGSGSSALFSGPSGLATDSTGAIYVSDSGNGLIRRVTTDGTVTTIAGLPNTPGHTDGDVSVATFNQPVAVATDLSGNIYVADYSPGSIRKISGKSVTTISPTTPFVPPCFLPQESGPLCAPSGLAVDASGKVLVSDMGHNLIEQIAPDKTLTTLAGGVNSPMGLVLGNDGALYIAGSDDDAIRKIPSGGSLVTLAGALPSSGSHDDIAPKAQFSFPYGVVRDSQGNVFVSDSNNYTIRKISPAGAVSTFAGTAGQSGTVDGTGQAARFVGPGGLTIDTADNLYVADDSIIRKVTPAGVVSTIAGSASCPGSTGAPGQVCLADSIALDTAGNLYVTDSLQNTVRKITPAGVATLFAGSFGRSGSQDGIGTGASFNAPRGIAVDTHGNLYIADSRNCAIREITPTGIVSTIAGTAGACGAVDGGLAAQFAAPVGVCVDSAGNVYVTDAGVPAIRVVSPTGIVTTLVGTANSRGIRIGPLPGSLNSPFGITPVNVTPQHLLVTDTVENVVLDITAAAPPSAAPAANIGGVFLSVGRLEPETLLTQSPRLSQMQLVVEENPNTFRSWMSVQATVIDSSGQQVAPIVTSAPGQASPEGFSAMVDVPTGTPGTFTVEAWMIDQKGGKSNIVTTPVRVVPSSAYAAQVATTGPDPVSLTQSNGVLYWAESGEDALKSVPVGGGTATVLATRMVNPASLAFSGSSVIWLDDRPVNAVTCASSITRVLKQTNASGASTTLASGPSCGGGASQIALIGSTVYWVSSTSSSWVINATPLSGGAATTVRTSNVPIVALNANAGSLFWMENASTAGTAAIYTLTPGGSIATVASSVRADANTFAVDATNVYYATPNTPATNPPTETLWAQPLIGGAPASLAASIATPVKLLSTLPGGGNDVVWIDAAAVNSVSATGGAVSPLAPVSGTPFDILYDGTNVLWTEWTNVGIYGESGSIESVPLSGGAVNTVYQGGDAPRELAQDAQGKLNWTEGGPVGITEGFARIARLNSGGGGDRVVTGINAAYPGTATVATSGTIHPPAVLPLLATPTSLVIADQWRIKSLQLTGGQLSTVGAPGGGVIGGIATDGTSVYWDDAVSSVSKAPVGGGTMTALVSPGVIGGYAGPGGPMALGSDGTLYWVVNDVTTAFNVSIGRTSSTAPSTSLNIVADRLFYVLSLAASATTIYATSPSYPAVLAYGPGQLNIPPQYLVVPTVMALDPAALYYREVGGDIVSVQPAPTGPSTPQARKILLGSSNPDPLALALDATSIYFVDGQKILKTPR